jgi:hypothetical protein
MNEKRFSALLTGLRKRAGFQSAKAFHTRALEQGLGCNYAHYMKIEKGLVLPTADLASRISRQFPIDEAEELIRAWCADELPSFSYLFSPQSPSPIESRSTQQQPSRRQAALSIRQVLGLARSQADYSLFVFSILARTPVPVTELEPFFKQRELRSSLQSLQDEGLVLISDGRLRAFSTEIRFPDASLDPRLKVAYAKFDEWDLQIAKSFKMENLLHKVIVRRISFRYLSLIQSQFALIFDLIKSADEVDTRYNDCTLHLVLTLSQGQLPG